MAEDKIHASMIIEILGRPPEHIKEALDTLVKKLGTEPGIKVIGSKIHEPTLVGDSKDLYTTFAEVDVEFNSLANYFGVMFAYMPANIEIISPETITLQNLDLNELGNRLLSRLHDYDAVTKKLIYERKFLVEKLHEFAPHLFKEKSEKENNKEEKAPEDKKAKEKPKK